MRATVVLLLLLAAACNAPAQRGQTSSRQPDQVGPCTDIAVAGIRTYYCFQDGLTVEEVDHGWSLPKLPFRPFAIAAQGDRDDMLLVVGGGEPGRSGWVAVLDANGKLLAKHRVGRDVAYAVDISRDRKHMAVGCADGRVLLYGMPRFGSLRTLKRHTAPCRSVAFSPDGTWLASGGRDGLVILNPVRRGKATVLQDHTAGVECVAFSPDSRRIASGALDGKVRVHEGGVLRRTYQKLGSLVSSVVFVPGGRLFASLDDGRVLRLGRREASVDVVETYDSPVFAMAYLYTNEEQDTFAVGLNGTRGWVVTGLQSPAHETPTAASKPASRPSSRGPASRPERR